MGSWAAAVTGEVAPSGLLAIGIWGLEINGDASSPRWLSPSIFFLKHDSSKH